MNQHPLPCAYLYISARIFPRPSLPRLFQASAFSHAAALPGEWAPPVSFPNTGSVCLFGNPATHSTSKISVFQIICCAGTSYDHHCCILNPIYSGKAPLLPLYHMFLLYSVLLPLYVIHENPSGITRLIGNRSSLNQTRNL